VPLKTIAQAMALPSGSTIRFWGGDTFLCTSGASFVPPSASTIGAFGTGQAFIQSNNCEVAVAPVYGTAFLPGIKVINDGSSWCGIGTNGPFVTIGCDVSGFGYDVVTNNHDVTIDGGTGSRSRIGGTTPTSTDGTGVFCNPGSYNIKIRNTELAFFGGSNSNPTQTGFGWHLSGIGDGNPVIPLAFTNGVPNNALCEIGPNVVIHDCGGNISNGGGGSNSGGENGAGSRIWGHDILVYNIMPAPGFTGWDMDGVDLGDDGAQHVLFERVVAFNCGGGALLTYDGGGAWGPVTIRYSLFVNSGLLDIGNFAFQGNHFAGAQYGYNNTIVQVVGGNAQANVRLYYLENSSGLFANNAVVTVGYDALLADVIPGAGFIMTHNGFFGGAGFSWGGPTYDFAEWVNQPNADASALSSDPMFVGTAGSAVPSDYALQAGSPYRKAGVDLSAAPYNFDLGTTDLGGNPIKPGTAPDIGAFAFNP
jgi:hypothetical protein